MKTLWVLLVMILSLSFSSLVEAVNWVYYITDNNLNKFYYEAESINHPAKDIVGVWQKIIYSEAGRKHLLEKNTWIKASDIAQARNFHEVNCITRDHRIKDARLFNSSGEIVISESVKTIAWEPIAPESFADFLYKEVCKKNKP